MPLAADDAVAAGEEVEVFVTIHVGIRAEIIRHESQAAANAVGIVNA